MKTLRLVNYRRSHLYCFKSQRTAISLSISFDRDNTSNFVSDFETKKILMGNSFQGTSSNLFSFLQVKQTNFWAGGALVGSGVKADFAIICRLLWWRPHSIQKDLLIPLASVNIWENEMKKAASNCLAHVSNSRTYSPSPQRDVVLILLRGKILGHFYGMIKLSTIHNSCSGRINW